MIEYLVKTINYKDYLLKEEEMTKPLKKKYANIGLVDEHGAKMNFEPAIIIIMKLYNLKDLLRRFLEEVTLMVDTIESSDENSDAVKLMTIHSSK